MKYLKILRLFAVAATALMAFSGNASATLTEASGNPVDAAERIHAMSTGIAFDGSVDVTCSLSTLEWRITAAGGTSGILDDLDFSECNKDTVTPIIGGSLSISEGGIGNPFGVMTSTGAEITVQLHRTVLGFPVTTHCIYVTNNTVIGSFSGAPGSGSSIDLDSSLIPVAWTDAGCGFSAELTGGYHIVTPSTLLFDA